MRKGHGRTVVSLLRAYLNTMIGEGVHYKYSCNVFYCENFLPNKNYKPKMWTTAWIGWLLKFGGPTPYRRVQNGSGYINYYTFHGGTNFVRTAWVDLLP